MNKIYIYYILFPLAIFLYLHLISARLLPCIEYTYLSTLIILCKEQIETVSDLFCGRLYRTFLILHFPVLTPVSAAFQPMK